jgi:uncharacterized repeat protein (TIGR01451 family)
VSGSFWVRVLVAPLIAVTMVLGAGALVPPASAAGTGNTDDVYVLPVQQATADYLTEIDIVITSHDSSAPVGTVGVEVANGGSPIVLDSGSDPLGSPYDFQTATSATPGIYYDEGQANPDGYFVATAWVDLGTVRSDTVTASFVPNAASSQPDGSDWNGAATATSAAMSFVVSQSGATGMSVEPKATPSTIAGGDDVTLEADLYDHPGGGKLPVQSGVDGTVCFYAYLLVGGQLPVPPFFGTALGCEPVSSPSPQSDTLDISSLLDDGDYQIKAFFTPGDPATTIYYAQADDVQTIVTVGSTPPPATPTTTTVSSLTGTYDAGDPVQLTATVSPAAAGTVTFAETPSGCTASGPVSYDAGTGVATQTVTCSANGYVATASFAPDDVGAYAASSDTVGQSLTVVAAGPPTPTSTTTVVTGPATATTGVATTYTATVAPPAAGTVQFEVDGGDVGSPVTVVSGVATRSQIFSSAGSHTVTATFTPTDAGAYAASADATGVTVTVSAPPPPPAPETPRISVTASASSVTVGSAVTFTAVISSSSCSWAGGTIEFFEGGQSFGGGTADGNQASGFTAELTPTTVGTHAVAVAYTPGVSSTCGGTSASATIEATEPPPSTVSVSVAGDRVVAGSQVTLSAVVGPAPTAAGSVRFSVDDVEVGGPVTVAGTRASLGYVFAAAGDHTVEAAFTPDDPTQVAGSSASATVTVVAAPVETSVTVTAPPRGTVGVADLFSVAVSASSGGSAATTAPLDGTVRFVVDGASVSGPVRIADGVSDTPLRYSFTSAGEHTVVAVFTPDDATAYEAGEGSASLTALASSTSSAESQSPAIKVKISLNLDISDYTANPSQFHSDLSTDICHAVEVSTTNFECSRIEILAVTAGRATPLVTSGAVRGRSAQPADKVVYSGACQGSGHTISCPLPALVPGATYRAVLELPTRPGLAGRTVSGTASVTQVRSDGSVATLAQSDFSAPVPRFTAISASLTSAHQRLRVGEPSRYVVAVKNTGKLTATKVSACVVVSAGVRVVRAPRASVKGHTVCWRHVTLRKGASLVKRLVLVAARRSTVRATLTVASPRFTTVVLATKVRAR